MYRVEIERRGADSLILPTYRSRILGASLSRMSLIVAVGISAVEWSHWILDSKKKFIGF